MSLQASLKDFKLAHVVEFISSSRKTGTLRISRPGAEGFIHFRNGKAFFASSSANRRTIGEHLVDSGKISREDLDKALALQESEGRRRRLGEILTKEGFIDSEELRVFVKEQIYDSFFDLYQWMEGEFSFEEEAAPAEEDIGISWDEWRKIKDTVSTLDTVYRLALLPLGEKHGVFLQPVEWNLLCLIDGKKTVLELIDESGETAFAVYRHLSNLLSYGLVTKWGEEEGARMGTAIRPQKRAARPPERPVPTVRQPAPAQPGPAQGPLDAVPVAQDENPADEQQPEASSVEPKPTASAPERGTAAAPKGPEQASTVQPGASEEPDRPWAESGISSEVQPLDADAIAESLMDGDIDRLAEARPGDAAPADTIPPEPAPPLIGASPEPARPEPAGPPPDAPSQDDLEDPPNIEVQIKGLGPMEIVTHHGPQTADWYMFTTPHKKGSLYVYADGHFISDVSLDRDEERAILAKIKEAA